MTASDDAARNARRAAALKDNLKRRKAQARARASGEGEAGLQIEDVPDKGPNAAQKQR